MRRAILILSMIGAGIFAGAFFLALVQGTPALAATPLPSNDMAGVWQGTLGKQRITVCFNGNTEKEEGAYYYQRHLQPIGLHPQNLRRWEETPGAKHPAWNLEAPAGGRVTGQWRAADGNSYLPIALQRVTASPKACASDTFNTPVEASQRVETLGPKKFGATHAYRELRYLGESTVELVGEGEVLQRINRDLRARLPHEAAARQAILDDQRSRMGGFFSGMYDETSAEPKLWSPDFVVVHFYRSTLGMGANGVVLEYVVWDLATGQRVDPWDWFPNSSGAEVGELPAGVAGFEEVAEANEVGDGCTDKPQDSGFLIQLRADGMQFFQDGPCGRFITVPYAKLDPLLNDKGRKAVARLRARRGDQSEY